MTQGEIYDGKTRDKLADILLGKPSAKLSHQFEARKMTIAPNLCKENTSIFTSKNLKKHNLQ